MVNKKIVVITQARVGSSRLPSKVLKIIGEQTLLDIHLKRLNRSKLANKIIVATTFEDGVDHILDIVKRNNVNVFQGSTDDVLDRFYSAVKNEKADYVVRVTSDCPLIDPDLLDGIIQKTIEEELDYCSNQLQEKFPDGQDVEVMTFSALEKAWSLTSVKSDREHVTPFIRNNSTFMNGVIFKSADFPSDKNYNDVRMTVDEQKDFDAVAILVNELGINRGWKEYTQYILDNPEKFENQKIIRNQGYLRSLKKV